jgi:hypothetical protein
MIDHPSLRLFRNADKTSMRKPSMAQALMRGLNVFRTVYEYRTLLASSEDKDDLSFNLSSGISNHPFSFVFHKITFGRRI